MLAKVERVFADRKERHFLAYARYAGLKKNRFNFTLLAMTRNLRRWTLLAPSSTGGEIRQPLDVTLAIGKNNSAKDPELMRLAS